MTLPHSLTHHEWETLRHIALSGSQIPRPACEAIGRLRRLEMIAETGGAFQATRLGRSAIVAGSPSLWSR